MFSRNGQYVINNNQQESFNRQLPSTSLKLQFKKQRQKFLNVNQRKYEIEMIKQQIHRKCKVEQLQYLDLLQKERKKYLKMKQQEQNSKKQYIYNFMNKKYQLKPEKRSRNSILEMRDSLDKQLALKQARKNNQFSLEPNKNILKERAEQNQWVIRVMNARKILQRKLGKYYQSQAYLDDSIQQTSQNSSSIVSSHKQRPRRLQSSSFQTQKQSQTQRQQYSEKSSQIQTSSYPQRQKYSQKQSSSKKQSEYQGDSHYENYPRSLYSQSQNQNQSNTKKSSQNQSESHKSSLTSQSHKSSHTSQTSQNRKSSVTSRKSQ